ncbi:MAG TPA: hypothetical protein VLL57_04305, partial [Candidatus Binataceae bacterium]|nr:hypothetical protein [Candidatus Binataceae bacterium]
MIEPAAPEMVGDSTANLGLSVSETRDGGLTGERRHLTVLFCDLLGSTEIATQLDPEDWRAVVAAYNHAAGRAIER